METAFPMIAALYALGSLPTAAAIAPGTRGRSSTFRLLCIAGWPALSVLALLAGFRRLYSNA